MARGASQSRCDTLDAGDSSIGGEDGSQAIDSAGDALVGRRLGNAQIGGDVFNGAVLEKAHEQQIPVFRAQPRDGAVECGQFVGDFAGGFGHDGLRLGGLSFVVGAAAGQALGVEDAVAGGLGKPTGQGAG